MATHQTITKKFFRLLIMLICLFLSIGVLMAYSNKIGKIDKNKEDIPNKGTKINGKDQNAKDTKLTKIAFEKDNNVYLYDEINEQIKSLGDNSKSKDLLELSPDKTKIVFRYFNEGKPIYPSHVIVYDIKTGKLTDIVINDNNVQQIVELKWIDDENILVTGHIDPSASGYGVYNIKSKLELMSCLGTVRDVAINEKDILYSDTPHIYPQLNANLYFNGNKIFKSDNGKEEIFDGAISKDGKIIAFRSWVANAANPNAQTIAYLNTAEVNSDKKSISNLKRIVINSDTTGVLKFDDKNNINIIDEKFIYKINDGKLMKVENTLPKQKELSAVQLKKFRQTLAKQFPKEAISNNTVFEDIDIYNMVAF